MITWQIDQNRQGKRKTENIGQSPLEINDKFKFVKITL